MLKLLAVTLVLFCAGQSIGQKCSVDSGFRGDSYSIDRYKNRSLIRTIQTLRDIPASVRSSLNAYLKSRLGEPFSRRVNFSSGYWIDLERLKNESPKDYEWNKPMGSYDLVFWFSDTTKGLKAFYFKLVLNDDGSIRQGMNLPDIAAHPEKAQIISFNDASSIAVNKGFPKHSISAQFEYSGNEKAFVWIVTDNRETEPDEKPIVLIHGRGTYKHIEINANTGSVVRIYKETIAL